MGVTLPFPVVPLTGSFCLVVSVLPDGQDVVGDCAGSLEGAGRGVVFFVEDLVGTGAFVGFTGRDGIGRMGFTGLGVLLGFVAAVMGSVVFTGLPLLGAGLFVETGNFSVV